MLAGIASKILLWHLVAEKPAGCDAGSCHCSWGFFLQGRTTTHLLTRDVFPVETQVDMAKGDLCCKGGEEEVSTPTLGMQWRAKQWCHAGRWHSGATQALENGLLGWEPSWQLLPTDLLRNQRFGVRQEIKLTQSGWRMVGVYHVKNGRKDTFL